jgi:hypothetical protein
MSQVTSAPRLDSREPRKRRFWRGQFAIADLLLGLTVVAAWTAFGVSRDRVEYLGARIRMLQQSVGELVIEDRTKYNAIAQTAIRYPDDAWQVFLPDGAEYQLNMVVSDILASGFPKPDHQIAMNPGLHKIELRRRDDGKTRFIITIDDQVALDVKEPSASNAFRASSSIGVHRDQHVQPIDQPLVLKRQRAHETLPGNVSRPIPDNEPAHGLLLWIARKNPQ